MKLLAVSLSVLPLAFALSSPQPQTTCTTFHLSNLTYASNLIYSTPAHLAVSTATISFDFSNPDAFSAQCIGYSSGQTNDAGFFAFPQIFTCTDENEGEGNVTFVWNRYAAGGSTLGVNQTWNSGENMYLATASTPVSLECHTTFWQNPNFTWPNPDGPYSTSQTSCNTLNLSVEAQVKKLK